MDDYKKIEKALIEVCLKIARRGEGALFVVGKAKYKPLIDQTVPSFKVTDNPKLLESLALIDGAVVINNKGYLEAYGVMIKSTYTFKNFGTRHSAAFSASHNGNLAVLVSEEDKKIRIFKDKKMIMQIDAMQRNVERSVPNVINFLESIGAGTVGTLGTSLIYPQIGIALLPGIVVFGSAYYLTKFFIKRKK